MINTKNEASKTLACFVFKTVALIKLLLVAILFYFIDFFATIIITKHFPWASLQRWIWAKNGRTLIYNLQENSMESHYLAWGCHALMKKYPSATNLTSQSRRNYPQSSSLGIYIRYINPLLRTISANESFLINEWKLCTVCVSVWVSECVWVCARPNVTVILQYDEREAITAPYCCPVKRAIRWQRQIDTRGTARMSDEKEEHSD